jgi:hypothetical protein
LRRRGRGQRIIPIRFAAWRRPAWLDGVGDEAVALSNWSGGWHAELARPGSENAISRFVARCARLPGRIGGRAAAVVLSSADYERLCAPKPSLVEFLRNSPWTGVELDIERDRSLAREADL